MANLGLGSGKIMIHKATEFSREASNMLKSAEQAQAFAQKMTNAQAGAREQNVQDVNKAEAAAISRENPKKKEGSASGKKKDGSREAQEKILSQADVGADTRRIDIRI